MIRNIFLTITIILYGCTSFNGKDVFIKDFEQFILIIRNRPTITEEEWVQFDKQYRALSEVRYRKYEKEFTEEEFKKIEKWRNDYQYLRYEYKLTNGIKNSIHKLKDFFKNITK